MQTPKIRLFLSDVDGVMTDAGMYYSEMGDELKRFNTYDGMGFKMLKAAGIQTGIITTEAVELNRRRAEKLKLDHICLGAADKVLVAQGIWEKTGISPSETAYIGDDINCLTLLRMVGWAACPANAVAVVKAVPGITQLQTRGGDGAVRDFAERVLATLPDAENNMPWTL